MQTLLLDQTNWDLVIDANRNIAVASNPYSVAQDAASEVKAELGTVWYDQLRGIPYNTQGGQLLGSFPAPISKIKADMIDAVMTNVPDVLTVQVFLTGLVGRQLSGQVQTTAVTDTSTPVALDF